MVKYVGWIECKPEDIKRLQELGVKGRLIYSADTGTVDFCEADEETVQRLIAEFPGFWPGCFTGVNESGEQLPPAEQKYWKLALSSLEDIML